MCEWCEVQWWVVWACVVLCVSCCFGDGSFRSPWNCIFRQPRCHKHSGQSLGSFGISAIWSNTDGNVTSSTSWSSGGCVDQRRRSGGLGCDVEALQFHGQWRFSCTRRKSWTLPSWALSAKLASKAGRRCADLLFEMWALHLRVSVGESPSCDRLQGKILHRKVLGSEVQRRPHWSRRELKGPLSSASSSTCAVPSSTTAMCLGQRIVLPRLSDLVAVPSDHCRCRWRTLRVAIVCVRRGRKPVGVGTGCRLLWAPRAVTVHADECQAGTLCG